jgi:hypothetical protein
MKAAHLFLGAALALSAAAVAGPASTDPDSRFAATDDGGKAGKANETGRTEGRMDDRSDQVTTTVRNGDSYASVTQSGDPETAVRRVEKRPGYTRLEQHSGNSHALVIQSDDGAGLRDRFREFFWR